MSFDSRITYKNRPYSIWQIEEKTSDEQWRSENFCIVEDEEECLDAGIDGLDEADLVANAADVYTQNQYECTNRSVLAHNNPLLIEQEKDILELAQSDMYRYTLSNFHPSFSSAASSNSAFCYPPYFDNHNMYSSSHKKSMYLHGTPTYSACVDNLRTQLLRNSVLLQKHSYANDLQEAYNQNSAISETSSRYDVDAITDKLLNNAESRKDVNTRSDAFGEETGIDVTGGVGGGRQRRLGVVPGRSVGVGGGDSASEYARRRTRHGGSILSGVQSPTDVVTHLINYSISDLDRLGVRTSSLQSPIEGGGGEPRDNDNRMRTVEYGTAGSSTSRRQIGQRMGLYDAADNREGEAERDREEGGRSRTMASRLGAYLNGLGIGGFGGQGGRRTSNNTTNSEDTMSDISVPHPYPAPQRCRSGEDSSASGVRRRGATGERHRVGSGGDDMEDFGRMETEEREEEMEREATLMAARRNREGESHDCSSSDNSDFLLPDLVDNNVLLF